MESAGVVRGASASGVAGGRLVSGSDLQIGCSGPGRRYCDDARPASLLPRAENGGADKLRDGFKVLFRRRAECSPSRRPTCARSFLPDFVPCLEPHNDHRLARRTRTARTRARRAPGATTARSRDRRAPRAPIRRLARLAVAPRPDVWHIHNRIGCWNRAPARGPWARAPFSERPPVTCAELPALPSPVCELLVNHVRCAGHSHVPVMAGCQCQSSLRSALGRSVAGVQSSAGRLLAFLFCFACFDVLENIARLWAEAFLMCGQSSRADLSVRWDRSQIWESRSSAPTVSKTIDGCPGGLLWGRIVVPLPASGLVSLCPAVAAGSGPT